jgi:hypothetical protein
MPTHGQEGTKKVVNMMVGNGGDLGGVLPLRAEVPGARATSVPIAHTRARCTVHTGGKS